MFEFRNGMLGVVIIALAIAGALFGSYLAGIETEQVEVTKYQYLADVSGQFDYDESPQYIDFEPSTNFTGYYSDKSYSAFDDTYYFAIDQVDFHPSQTEDGRTIVNNYRINVKPVISASATINLTTRSLDMVNYAGIHYYYNTNGNWLEWFNTNVTSIRGGVLLKTVVESLDLNTEEWNNVLISLGNDVNWDDRPSGIPKKHLELDTILIIPKQNGFINLTSPNMDMSQMDPGSADIQKPFRSFKVDLTNWNVTCYYSTDYTGDSQVLRADSLVVCYGSNTRSEPSSYDELNLGNLLVYTLMFVPDRLYLDPNQGVWLK